MRRILFPLFVITTGGLAGYWFAISRPTAPDVAPVQTLAAVEPSSDDVNDDLEELDGSLDGVDYDRARRLLDDAVVAHGESLHEFQTTPTRAEALVESTKRRAVADAELNDAYRHIELRDRSPIGSAEYIDHDREAVRHAKRTIRAAASWHRATLKESTASR